ncbi:MAG: carboxy terminal-processing peptidase [Bacteroidota bacterium]
MHKLIFIAAFAALTSFGVSTGLTHSHSDDGSEELSDTLKILEPKPEHASEAFVITNLLKRYHYRKLPLSDSISSVIFDNYFASLDPNKAYFFEEDLQKFEHLRNELDDEIPAGDLDFAYHVFELYRERALERIDYVFSILETEFDFSVDESYNFDRTDEDWPSTEKGRDDIWRKIIKSQALTYKLAGNDWDKIVESLTKRYQRIKKAIYQYNSEDVFQSYMNAYTNAYDPHTDYFSPPDAENFQIEMGLSLEGIGARLMQNLDYTQVADIIPGGPAYKSKEILKDDRIIGVAQGDEGEFVDVIGWRLDDVVSKIRGPKGSVVRLQILKASDGVNGMPDTLRLVRDKIKLESQAAKSELIPITEGNTTYNLGVITVPSFYLNFDDLNAGVQDYRSTTRDVKKLIDELKEQGMNGLMIDLRFNGGGSLQEAIEMTGLFIPDGPVVQVRNTDQSVDKMEDKDGGEVFYDGPLAVLVNRGSASASEIFSGAIQDYKRGVIIGESTFGKGTVQNVIDLDRYIRNPDMKLGQLKMTLAKFYRITGSSNQRIGIAPDVQFPSVYDAEDFGEASRPNALPWDEIENAKFKTTNNIDSKLVDKLNELYRIHLNSDPDLKKLVKEIEEAKQVRSESMVSLNLEERKKRSEEETQQQTGDDLSTTVDQNEVTAATEIDQKLKDDPYLKEGLKLLAEIAKRKIG